MAFARTLELLWGMAEIGNNLAVGRRAPGGARPRVRCALEGRHRVGRVERPDAAAGSGGPSHIPMAVLRGARGCPSRRWPSRTWARPSARRSTGSKSGPRPNASPTSPRCSCHTSGCGLRLVPARHASAPARQTPGVTARPVGVTRFPVTRRTRKVTSARNRPTSQRAMC